MDFIEGCNVVEIKMYCALEVIRLCLGLTTLREARENREIRDVSNDLGCQKRKRSVKIGTYL